MKKTLALGLATLLFATGLCACQNTVSSPASKVASAAPSAVSVAPPYPNNPLTGLPKAAGYPEDQRPLAVMINNAKDSLPQSNISNADILYEMVTEGGITRLMAVYTDFRNLALTGPVRSARDQFIHFVLPIEAIYTHIGTSRYAKDMLNFFSYQNIDGIYLGATAFTFDETRNQTMPPEHCWFSEGSSVVRGIQQLGLSDRRTKPVQPVFPFAAPGAVPTLAGGDAHIVQFQFSGVTDAGFTYDAATKKYMKGQFGAPQMDAATGKQLTFDNVFVLGTEITMKPDNFCTDFNFHWGEGYYFTGGRYLKIKWQKGDPQNQMTFTDMTGKPIEVTAGKSYVAFTTNAYLGAISITVPPPPAPPSSAPPAPASAAPPPPANTATPPAASTAPVKSVAPAPAAPAPAPSKP